MTAVLDLGIDLDVWPWVWLGVAVVFALIELTALAGSFVLLPFAVSAFAASLAGFYDTSVEVQWAIFFFGGAALWVVFWKNVKRFVDENAMPAGVGASRLVGMTAIVTVDVDPDDTSRSGRVKVVGEEWGALTEQQRVLRTGAKVRVLSMEGTRVIVEPVPIEADTRIAPDGPLLKPPNTTEQNTTQPNTTEQNIARPNTTDRSNP
ncbi:MAG: NfeD family protein [Ilumatobacter sp.]|uniref:NfeD family protein n=1 Tax=Ilumatobacter sp. TaxID=1967498 RepID=UPI003C787CBA